MNGGDGGGGSRGGLRLSQFATVNSDDDFLLTCKFRALIETSPPPIRQVGKLRPREVKSTAGEQLWKWQSND